MSPSGPGPLYFVQSAGDGAYTSAALSASISTSVAPTPMAQANQGSQSRPTSTSDGPRIQAARGPHCRARAYLLTTLDERRGAAGQCLKESEVAPEGPGASIGFHKCPRNRFPALGAPLSNSDRQRSRIVLPARFAQRTFEARHLCEGLAFTGDLQTFHEQNRRKAHECDKTGHKNTRVHGETVVGG